MPLAPYTGSWGRTQAIHLLRRATFGPRKADVDYMAGLTMTQAVNEITNTSYTIPAPPLNDYHAQANDPNVPAGQTWVNAPIESGLEWYRLESMRAWWAGLMMNESRNVREKMTLFLHNYLPICTAEVNNPIMVYEYLSLLRANALGNYKSLVKDITLDRSMLWFLDGQSNAVWGPNENYSRELQELFTIGKDIPSTYTPDDIAAAAKVLTGWTIKWNPGQADHRTRAYFPSWHDTSTKQFSAFYNNTVINGDSSANGGENEINQLINMIFNNNEVAKYFVRRLYRYFVYYKIDAATETNIITPLADTFRSSGYNMHTVLVELFSSQHFYDAQHSGALIKCPVQLTVGTAKLMGIPIPTSSVQNQYAGWRVFYNLAKDMNQELLNPPNVNGWPAFTNPPFFHEIWINPDTLRYRKQFFSYLTSWGYNSGTIKIDVLAFTATLSDPSNPNTLISEFAELAHNVTLDANMQQQLKNILLDNLVGDFYWSNIWNAYLFNPGNTSNRSVAETRLKNLYGKILNMAETNLA